jgi:nucleoid-associated protein YejK
MPITLTDIELNVREPIFETLFLIALKQFCESPSNDEDAALEALRESGLRCKSGTEKVLMDKMAWFALKQKSLQGIVKQDAADLLSEALNEYIKRELSFWSFLYR